ncbi:enoyl-CoA hydratase/isomerase family protein [Blastococcus sp. URHD0036]|uniref:enoyl-CoA hydratase/isomerase family protein n=1 Tax=Blastococcus sp. URHD0036 TaxID=1380356 RepID=UPI00068CE7EA|nr:enoyl-CoA hydratase/isomerase family protein [Blastococcus sp. URHD0036]
MTGPRRDEAGTERVVVTTEGSVTTITLNRPEKLNAFDGPMMARFRAAVRAAMLDPGTRVVVLAGEGRAFSAGFDVTALAAAPDEAAERPIGSGLGGSAALTEAAGDFVNNRERAHDWLLLRNSPKPLIAQVHGYCLGVANEIVGCCDLVYCSESARFGMPEVRQGIGLPPTLGFWPLRIGVARTKELLFTGRLVEGREAARIGLADVVVQSDEALREQVAGSAARIAETPADRLAVVKQAVDRWADVAGVADAVSRGAEFHALFHQTHAAG